MDVALRYYLIGSCAIGLAQIVDAVVLIKYQDRALHRALAAVFSFIEYVWAGVSFEVWQRATEYFPRWLPASFIAYVAVCFAVGIFLLLKQRTGKMKQQSRKIRLPARLVVLGGCFGACFALASWLTLIYAR